MALNVFKKRKPRKFNYIPRFYDKKTHKLIYNRLGDGRFAQKYAQKKKAKGGFNIENEHKIDFSSYRTRSKASSRTPQMNTFIILVGMLLVILIFWLISNPEFTNIFTNE